MNDSNNTSSPTLTHPKQKANFLSRLFFIWQVPIVIDHFKRESSIIYTSLKEYDSEVLSNKLEQAWEKELRSNKPSLWRAILQVFGIEYCAHAIFTVIIRILLVTFMPQCFLHILNYYQPNQMLIREQQMIIYMVAVILLLFFFTLEFHNSILNLGALGMKLRVACSSLLYKKALSMNRKTLGDSSNFGQVVNILSNDVNRFDYAFQFAQYVLVAPLEIIISAYNLDTTLGHSTITGVVVLSLIFILQAVLSKVVAILRDRVAVETDKRLQLMNEIISGIRIIKMYTWEKNFRDLVNTARKKENEKIMQSKHLSINISTYKQFVTHIGVFACIMVAYLFKNDLNAAYIFTTYVYYTVLKISVSALLPRAIITGAEANTAVLRIQNFLQLDHSSKSNLHNDKFLKLTIEDKISLPGISASNLAAQWSSTADILRNVNFNAKSHDLVAVIGAAGGGKSTLLQTFLHETHIVKGELNVIGTLSYASQEPWIFPASVRQNVLFGAPFNQDRYQAVLRKCGLESDLAIFLHGDQTLVGDRGAMLSGGQKARINLARAVYRDVDIYLLDDPLSAVDSQVAKHIFEECINSYLRHKCVILVTHQVHFLKNVEKIYVLDSGEVTSYGTYAQILQSTAYIDQIVESKLAKKANQTNQIKKSIQLKVQEPQVDNEENQEISQSAVHILLKYFARSYNIYVNILLLVLFISTQLLTSLSDYYLTFWANYIEEHHNSSKINKASKEVVISDQSNENFLYFYIIMIVSVLVLNFFQSWLFVKVCITAAKHLHNSMFINILKSGMRFYDRNSAGRILNRFSRDLGTMDEMFPLFFIDALQGLINILVIALIIMITNAFLSIGIVIVCISASVVAFVFLRALRVFGNAETITRSPVYTHISAALQGITTVRAFKMEKVLIKEFDNLQNANSSMYYLQLATVESVGFWIDAINIVFLTAVLWALYFYNFETRVGSIGLIISQSIALISMLQGTVKFCGDTDRQLISLQRIQEYTKLVPEEDSGKFKPSESWPNQGTIEYQSVYMQYSPNEPLNLKNISFKIQAGQKIGIVGRTGSGKSSLVSILYRLYPYDGHIFIDSIDTKQLSLQDLRSKISVIPQDPILFAGSIRKNLDPFDKCSDAEIWTALEQVEMGPIIQNLAAGLNYIVQEGGANFSVGQKQLLCLVRAILKKSKILVLDEVTANIDEKTDELIQSSIRKIFKESTVLTIAHRLNTIMDSDMILVMESGSLVEFDHPYTLLKDLKGYFYNYVIQNGAEMAQQLINTAKTKYENDINNDT